MRDFIIRLLSYWVLASFVVAIGIIPWDEVGLSLALVRYMIASVAVGFVFGMIPTLVTTIWKSEKTQLISHRDRAIQFGSAIFLPLSLIFSVASIGGLGTVSWGNILLVNVIALLLAALVGSILASAVLSRAHRR